MAPRRKIDQREAHMFWILVLIAVVDVVALRLWAVRNRRFRPTRTHRYPRT